MSSGLARPTSEERQSQSLSRENPMLADQKAFSSLLADSICESIVYTMGKDVLSLLDSRGLLDDLNNPRELDRKLRSMFGNVRLMLERIIVKGLYQKPWIPFDSSFGFDYAKALDIAQAAFFVEI